MIKLPNIEKADSLNIDIQEHIDKPILQEAHIDLVNTWWREIVEKLLDIGRDDPLNLTKTVSFSISLRTLFELNLFFLQLQQVSDLGMKPGGINKDCIVDIAIRQFIRTRDKKFTKENMYKRKDVIFL